MDKYTYMREMSRDGIRELLLKGGFCPERVDIKGEGYDESLEPFFTENAASSCECSRGTDTDICRRCIAEFLEENI
ncbi:MAG: hypothetical protein E7583_03140 [Ruminococcaceae bacterium]|nr:hypothetical protein [Oscillospiraceae bacterium]